MSKTINSDKENLSEDIKKQFDEIDAQSSADLNGGGADSGIELERKAVPSMSDDELAQVAKNSLSDYYDSGVKSILDSNEKSKETLNSKAEKALENFEKSKDELANQIEKAKDNAEKQAIRRGLARSSIIMNQLEGYDKMKIDQTAKMEQELNSQIAQINAEIDTLSSRLDDSLRSFDLSYAVKLQNKINDLKEQQTQKIEKALEYNNKIALQEAEFNLKQKQADAKLNSSSSSALAQDNSKAKYEVASKYFATLSKEDALYQLLNADADYFREQLGNYYFKLYNEIRNR